MHEYAYIHSCIVTYVPTLIYSNFISGSYYSSLTCLIAMLMSLKCENISIDKIAIATAEKDKPFSTSVDISCDWLKTQYAVS